MYLDEAYELKQPMYLAVYGTLREGYGNHRRLLGAEKVGDFKTTEKFVMTARGIPFVTKDTEGYEPSQITVEIYKVTNGAQLASADQLEGHPSMYRREPVSIEGFDEGEVQLYFYQYGPQGAHIASGDYSNYKRY